MLIAMQKWHSKGAAVFCSLLAVISVIPHAHGSSFVLKNEQSRESLSTQVDEFAWEKLSPSNELQWTDCYTGRQCTRLIVPLNHSEPDGAEAVIALIRKPAAVPITSPSYRGPILFNPGGPGGSGVDMIQGRGDLLSAIVGPNFDVVGFDPRGISRSTPRASFFKTHVERSLFGVGSGLPLANNSVEGISRSWARGRLLGNLAAETDDGYLRHINTDQTAHDMLRIVEAHGRDKIQYWGFSYGSVLGASFAAMFPDRIERLIIDGVVDSENYYATLWSNNLLNTDKVMDSFFDGCHEAGPEDCDFWAPSPDDIRKNLTSIYDSLRSRPIPVKTEKGYGLVDYAMVRGLVFRALYSPFAAFRPLATALAALATGDASLIFDRAFVPPTQCSCDPSDGLFTNVPDAQSAVLCNDGKDVPGDFASSEKYFDMLTKASQWGEIWASIRMGCVGWPKFPKDHFQGPFIANTSHPLLLIGNTADPVTPLWAAKKMSKGFEGSAVLTQNSPGHCSISGPSLCTQKYIREYFISGKLPPPGTVCEVDTTPFSPPPGSPRANKAAAAAQKVFDSSEQSALEGTNEEEDEMLQAIMELSRNYAVHTFV
ncbi:hypothetical protein D9613_009061 [Agrocybe pediades]|uniref:Uncharacterized protein n=1 Tax=Agrocybe pediades TaxID=84607 RepID=A0A8H4VVM2_9AGAR|nr:hypothetical protein D9613_009061 [Agrocybe pediades]